MAKKPVILFTENVIAYLDQLLFILYEKEYFSSQTSAKKYVLKIYDFIEHNISTFPHKTTPIQLKQFGSNYIFYKPNERTTWYRLFKKIKGNYLVTAIFNNYCSESNYF